MTKLIDAFIYLIVAGPAVVVLLWPVTSFITHKTDPKP